MTRKASSLEPQALFAGDAARDIALVSDTELRQLRVFCVVVAAGGFSAATAELQVDLSAVSRQFKELELRVGARLAQRGRGGFALTPQGEQLHRSVRHLFGALQTFRGEVAGLSRQAGPLLRLGLVDALLTAPHTAGPLGLPAALAACADALPGLQVQVLTLRPIEIERRLLTQELDAGILAAHAPAAGLEQHRLYAEPNSLFVAPGHPWHGLSDRPLEAAELEHAAFVMDPYSVDLPHPELAGMRHSRTHADSIEGVALLIASGRYAGFLPDHLVQAVAPLAGLRRVQPERFSYAQDIVLTCRQGNGSVAVRQLVQQLLRPASSAMQG